MTEETYDYPKDLEFAEIYRVALPIFDLLGGEMDLETFACIAREVVGEKKIRLPHETPQVSDWFTSETWDTYVVDRRKFTTAERWMPLLRFSRNERRVYLDSGVHRG